MFNDIFSKYYERYDIWMIYYKYYYFINDIAKIIEESELRLFVAYWWSTMLIYY